MKIFLLVSLFIIQSLVSSCVSTPKAPEMEQPFLWQVSIEEQADACLVFGSFHLGVSSSFLNQNFWKLFEDKKVYVFELEIDRASQKDIQDLIFNPHRENLSDKISAESFALLEQTFKELSKAELNRLSLVGSFQLLMERYLSDNGALDLELLLKARNQKGQLVFLESFEFQSNLLRGIIDRENVESLITGQKQAKEELAKLKTIYLSGKEEALKALLEDGNSKLALNSEQELLLLEQRNLNWLDKLDPIIKNGDCFVTVGAAHLIGKSNLLTLLKTRGFHVKRVSI